MDFTKTSISSLCEVLKGSQVELVKQLSEELLSRAKHDTCFFRKVKSQHMACILVEYKRSKMHESLREVASVATEVLMRTGDRNFWDLLLGMKLFPEKALRLWECLPKEAKHDALLVGRVVLEFKHFEEICGQSQRRKQHPNLDKLAAIAGWQLLQITKAPGDLYVLRFLEDQPQEGKTLQREHDVAIGRGEWWFEKFHSIPLAT